MPITKLYKKQKLNGGEFVHIDTGEMLNSVVDFTSVNVPTDKVTISSLEYIIIDSKAKRYVEQLFNQAECGRIFKMADMVYGCYNLLYKDSVPHTKETLSFKERVSIDFALNHLLGVLGGIDKDAVVRDELSLSNESPLSIGRYVRDRDHVMSFREVKGAQGLPEGENND